MPLGFLRLSGRVAKRRGRILLRLTDDYTSITIINSTWFFKVEYEVDDSGLCSVTCRRLCAVLWGGAVLRRSVAHGPSWTVFKLRLLGVRIMLLNADSNLADKYCSMAAVRKKIGIKVIMTTGAGGTTLVYTRVFTLCGLYTQF